METLQIGQRVKHKLSGQCMTVKSNKYPPVYRLTLEVPEPYFLLGQEMAGDTAVCHGKNLIIQEPKKLAKMNTNITPSKNWADQYLKNYIQEKSAIKMKSSEISDFNLTGDETDREIEEIADDYISEIESEKAADIDDRRMNGDFDDSPSLDMNLHY